MAAAGWSVGACGRCGAARRIAGDEQTGRCVEILIWIDE